MKNPDETKRCARCKADRPVSDYCSIPSRGRLHCYCRQCSRELGREAYARRKAGTSERSKEHRDALSKSLRKKWASGTRVSSVSDESRMLNSIAQKEQYEAGRIPVGFNHESGKRARMLADPEKVAAAARRVAIARIGQLNPPGPSARGVGHWKAKQWEILSPDRIRYQFINLSEFVREHSALFDEKDVEWKKASCRAVKRIGGLFSTSPKTPNSWKGWRAIKSGDKP